MKPWFSFLIHILVMSFTLNSHANTSALIPVAYDKIQGLNASLPIHQLVDDHLLSVTVWLKFRNSKALHSRVAAIYDPYSQYYQHYLSKVDFEKQFAPNINNEKLLKRYFESYGLQVELNHHRLHLKGQAHQIKQAFHTQIQTYIFEHKPIYANTTPPLLPRTLAPFVSYVTGLNNVKRFKPVSEMRQDIMAHNMIEATPSTQSLEGFSGHQLQKAYNLDNLPVIDNRRLDGTGETIIILDGCGSQSMDEIIEDANTYFKNNDIPPFVLEGPHRNFSIANPDGTPFQSCQSEGQWSREIALDIQAAHTLAPGANIVLVTTDIALENAQASIIDTLIDNHFTFASFANATVMSQSWSGVETDNFEPLESMLEMAAGYGISVNFSSGDCGDNTYSHDGKCPNLNSPRANYPATSAFVTAVGGSSVFVDQGYHYAFEQTWGTYRDDKFAGGSGGGISQFHGPVAWQTSISTFIAHGYGVINDFGNKRAVPDITMLGDPYTGLKIIYDGQTINDGGTSLACPLFSAVTAMINQYRRSIKAVPIGHVAPYLYQYNQSLLNQDALRPMSPPHTTIPGSVFAPEGAPDSSFSFNEITFGWNSSLSIEPLSQFWNDAAGVGSPNIPNFIEVMANL